MVRLAGQPWYSDTGSHTLLHDVNERQTHLQKIRNNEMWYMEGHLQFSTGFSSWWELRSGNLQRRQYMTWGRPFFWLTYIYEVATNKELHITRLNALRRCCYYSFLFIINYNYLQTHLDLHYWLADWLATPHYTLEMLTHLLSHKPAAFRLRTWLW